jgi:hypothetical protein
MLKSPHWARERSTHDHCRRFGSRPVTGGNEMRLDRQAADQ